MQKMTFAYAIGFALTSITSYPEQLRLQLTQPTSYVSAVIQMAFKQPAPPDNGTPTGRPRGTASRGECAAANSGTNGGFTLTPLTPSNNWGFIVSDSPTIWVHVLYKADRTQKELSGEFSLQEKGTSRNLPPGRIAVPLPKTSGAFSIAHPYSLEVNKWYRWRLVIDCSSPNSPNKDYVYVEGWIRRVELPNLESQLKTKTLQERITFYSDKGIWYDALNDAAKLHCQNLQNPAPNDKWAALLTTVSLAQIARNQVICPERF